MKICLKCKEQKDLAEFNFKIRAKGTKQAHCKICTRLYVKQHYYKNKDYYLKKAHRNNVILRKSVQDYLWGYLGSHFCTDCGEKDILVLEFDHRENKYKEIGKMVTGRYSLERVKKEVEKCDVRCANCHRRKTALQQGWHKLTLAPIA